MQYSKVKIDNNSYDIVDSTDMEKLISGMLCLDMIISRDTFDLALATQSGQSALVKENIRIYKELGLFTDPGSNHVSSSFKESLTINNAVHSIESASSSIMWYNPPASGDPIDYFSVSKVTTSIPGGQDYIIKIEKSTEDGIEFSEDIKMPFDKVQKCRMLYDKITLLMDLIGSQQKITSLLDLHTSSLNPHEEVEGIIASYHYLESCIYKSELEFSDRLIHTPSNRSLATDEVDTIELPGISYNSRDGKLIVGDRAL